MGRLDLPQLVVVVALAANGVIGRNGDMPWRVPSDLQRYRRLTMGKPMIMGRKTLESIGRVLDGRDTVVLTRAATVPFVGARVAGSPREALSLAHACAKARGANEIVIAGGAEIYSLFLPLVVRLYVTRIEAEPQGDTRFPPIDPRVWRLSQDDPCEPGPEDGAASRFQLYDRIAGGAV